MEGAASITPDTKLDGQHSLLTSEQVERMRENDKNVFLEYTYDKVDRVLPMKEVEQTLRRVMKRYSELRRSTGETSDAKLRERLTAESEVFDQFSHTHPTIFRKVTDRDTPPKVIETLCGMMGLRQRQEAGQISDAQVAGGLEQYLRRQCGAGSKPPPQAREVTPKKSGD